MWKEKRIKQLIKTKEILESQQKTLEADRKLSIAAIAKADVRTADSIEANKVDGIATKNPVLVLQLSAILGDKASPKVLIQFRKALTSYFDKTRGTYAILRIIIKYVCSKITSGKPSVEFPMERDN